MEIRSFGDRPFSRFLFATLVVGAWAAVAYAFLMTSLTLPRETYPAPFGGDFILSLSGDGRLVFTGSALRKDDPTSCDVRVWDVESGRLRTVLRGHTDAVNHFAVSPDGRLVVTAALDRTARLWDLETGRELRTLGRDLLGGYLNVAFAPDGRTVLAVTPTEAVRWDVTDGREVMRRAWEGPSRPAQLRVGEGGRARVFLSDWDKGVVEVLDFETGVTERTFAFGPRQLGGAVASADGKRLTTDHPGRLRLWDVDTGEERPVNASMPPSHTSRTSPDGRYLLAPEVRRRPHNKLPRLVKWVSPSAADAMKQRRSQGETRLALFDVVGGESYHDLPLGPSAFTADGRLVIVTNEEVSVWDVPPRVRPFSPVAWACLALALLLTVLWRRRRVRT